MVDKPQLRARTDAFHALRSSLPQTLQALRQQGTEVEILSGCACPFIPLSKSTDVVSDTLVNTSSSALNPSIAETADPTEYEIKKQSSYFPENTRYFPGVAHTKALKTEAVQKALAEILLK